MEGRARPCRARAPRRRSNVAALNEAQRAIRRQAHQTLAKVTDDIGRRRTFNTAIAAVMELLNAAGQVPAEHAAGSRVMQEALEIAVLALSPIIPHVAHAMWQALGHATALIDEPWPAVDAAALEQSTVDFVVQVNGKLRARITVPAGRRRGGRARRRTCRCHMCRNSSARPPCAKLSSSPASSSTWSFRVPCPLTRSE